jgi:hypothetical protein
MASVVHHKVRHGVVLVGGLRKVRVVDHPGIGVRRVVGDQHPVSTASHLQTTPHQVSCLIDCVSEWVGGFIHWQ